MAAPVPILATTELTRRFGTFTAVDRLTLAVNAGELFGLLGANGAGRACGGASPVVLLTRPRSAGSPWPP
jgi:ABC-type uncharacterized transport system ATPase subunit